MSSGGIPAGGFAGATGVPGNPAASFGGAAGGGIGLGGITAIAGLGNSIVGAIAQYRASKAAKKYSKKQAAQAEKAGRMNAAAVAINRRKLIGAQRAAFGASGEVANSGSPLDLMIDNFILGLVDESRALSDASYRVSDINAQGAIAQRAAQFSAIRTATTGIVTAAQRGLFSIDHGPQSSGPLTVLGS